MATSTHETLPEVVLPFPIAHGMHDNSSHRHKENEDRDNRLTRVRNQLYRRAPLGRVHGRQQHPHRQKPSPASPEQRHCNLLAKMPPSIYHQCPTRRAWIVALAKLPPVLDLCFHSAQSPRPATLMREPLAPANFNTPSSALKRSPSSAGGADSIISRLNTVRSDEWAAHRAKKLHDRHVTIRLKRMVRGFICCTQVLTSKRGETKLQTAVLGRPSNIVCHFVPPTPVRLLEI